jgi:cytochrome P450
VSINKRNPYTVPDNRSHVFHSWRRMRRAAQEALTKTAVQSYHPIQTKEATILASALLSNPKNRDQHFQRAAASIMTSILYDFSIQILKQDSALQDIDRTADSFVKAAARTSLVEFFPWMMFIPQRSRLFTTNHSRHLHLK